MGFLKKKSSSKETEIQEAEVLLELQSPACPITAIVEQDNRTVYFYLWGAEESNFGVKSSWVRNLKKATQQLETALMEKGVPPMQTEEFCKHPNGLEKLNKDNLSIIWLEEGDSAALLLNGEVISIIPSWAGQNGFNGYSKEAKGQGDFAWELSDDNALYDRVHASKEFWDAWDLEQSPFNILQPKILDTYNEAFGEQDNYFAIDGNQWPPKGLYLKKGESKTIFATVGLSLIPMPVVEMYTENRFDANRIEFGFLVNSPITDEAVQQIGGWMSAQTTIPWHNITFLGEGHTIEFMSLNSSKLNFVLLTSQLNILPEPNIEKYRNSKTNFLWMVPISEKERQHIVDNGSTTIINELNKIGEEVFSLDRAEVI